MTLWMTTTLHSSSYAWNVLVEKLILPPRGWPINNSHKKQWAPWSILIGFLIYSYNLALHVKLLTYQVLACYFPIKYIFASIFLCQFLFMACLPLYRYSDWCSEVEKQKVSLIMSWWPDSLEITYTSCCEFFVSIPRSPRTPSTSSTQQYTLSIEVSGFQIVPVTSCFPHSDLGF